MHLFSGMETLGVLLSGHYEQCFHEHSCTCLLVLAVRGSLKSTFWEAKLQGHWVCRYSILPGWAKWFSKWWDLPSSHFFLTLFVFCCLCSYISLFCLSGACSCHIFCSQLVSPELVHCISFQRTYFCVCWFSHLNLLVSHYVLLLP